MKRNSVSSVGKEQLWIRVRKTEEANLIEVADDFVEKAETLQALLVDIVFIVELLVVGD